MNERADRRMTVGVFGLVSWDQILHVDSYPQAGDYRIVRQELNQSGGPTGNTAVALSRLGIDVSVASRVGHDDAGQRVLDDLRKEGCQVEHVRVLDGEPTDRAVVVLSGADPQPERTIYWLKGARLRHGHVLPIDEFFAKDLVILDVDDARLRLLLLDLPMHVSPRTRILGTLTCLTEMPPHHGFELALRHDYLAGAAAELQYIAEADSLTAAIERFQREMVLSQVRYAAITLGADGCLIVTRDEIRRIPAFEIDVVDPTGAGDAFAAGISYGILKQWDSETTGSFANAMGALATRSTGGRTSLPSIDEVRDFIERARIRQPAGDDRNCKGH